MKKIYVTLLLFIVVLQGVLSQSIDINKAKLVATNLINNKKTTSNNDIKNVLIEKEGGVTVFYVINFEIGGWVIISNNTSTLPLLGYNTQGEFTFDNEMPLQLADLLTGYKEQIKSSDYLKSANVKISERWSDLESSTSLKSLKSYTPGTNLLDVLGRGEVLWEQEKNYAMGGDFSSTGYNVRVSSKKEFKDKDITVGFRVYMEVIDF